MGAAIIAAIIEFLCLMGAARLVGQALNLAPAAATKLGWAAILVSVALHFRKDRP